MLPKTPKEWTLDSIKQLVMSGYQESESFDFKRQLPHRRAEDQKSDLQDDCCAFANSNGGFIVFGVEDAQKSIGEARIVGIDTLDFPSKFGNYPSSCQPSVSWQSCDIPIKLDDGKFIQVIYIPKSFNGPHAVKRDNRWVFKKRTNKGNENMSYDEIRLAFINHHDRLRRAFLLKTELDEIRYEAEQCLDMIVNTNFPARFDLSVLDALWSDVYPLVHANTKVTNAITRLRRLCRNANRNAAIIERWSFRGPIEVNHLHTARENNRNSLNEIASITADALGELQRLFP